MGIRGEGQLHASALLPLLETFLVVKNFQKFPPLLMNTCSRPLYVHDGPVILDSPLEQCFPNFQYLGHFFWTKINGTLHSSTYICDLQTGAQLFGPVGWTSSAKLDHKLNPVCGPDPLHSACPAGAWPLCEGSMGRAQSSHTGLAWPDPSVWGGYSWNPIPLCEAGVAGT